MPDENRVFDVTKPKHVSPSATSRPVIVGHHPVVSDPMVRDDLPKPTKIQVSDSDEPSSDNSYIVSSSGEHAEPVITPPTDDEMKAAELIHHDPSTQSHTTEDTAAFKISPVEDEIDSQPSITTEAPVADTPTEGVQEATADVPPADPNQPLPQIEGLHLPEHHRRGKGPLIALLVVVLLAIGAYLAIDAGLVGSNINLPFHVFKQKSPANPAATAPPASTPKPKPSLPTGFKEYKIASTPITFAAPTVWGDPVSTTEAGYSKRGGDNQSDGTYAYLVNFATNKDVQIAVTSGKYLPPARDKTYYDFLQWCTGTSDGMYYQSILHFSTTDKIDSPTTITCDQGPLSDVIKINSSTIEQTKTKDAKGNVIGDIYTKNLTDPSLVVLRVKDAGMTNGIDIKQFLNTVTTTTATP